MDPWFLANLACPYEWTPLRLADGCLICTEGHRFPIVAGVPVLLRSDVDQTHGEAEASVRLAEVADDQIIETQRREAAQRATCPDSEIDPVVSQVIAATNGLSYRHLVGNLPKYPIPHLRLPKANGESLLDIGCNWGRWTLAAAAKGYMAVGIDPSLGAVLSACRVARQLGHNTKYVVGDARFLPFRPNTFDVAFSYSVLQHFSHENAAAAVKQIARVLKVGGTSLIQMPNVFGMRCLYHQARRGFRRARDFEVRYWTIASLRTLFSQIGQTTIHVDCFFGIGLQAADMHLMPLKYKAIIALSEALRNVSSVVRPMKYVADSVYLLSIRQGPEQITS
jgi:SAM-dependent methyltransferase/uncharacterized protein YbaR (Trm112 family)